MSLPTVKTRVLIISDTHGAPLDEHGHGGCLFRSPLPAADVCIHCGDLTMAGGINEYNDTLDMLKAIDAPIKLVIAGNHDLSLDRDYMFSHQKFAYAQDQVERARDLWLSPAGRAVQEGVTFLREGVHQIALKNGAHVNVYASPYTPEFYDWGFPYNKDEDRFNSPLKMLSDAKNVAPYPVPCHIDAASRIDVLITHGPPYGRLDRTSRGDLPGCPHLLRAAMRSRPLLHCFGHIHEGWGAERVRWSDQADRAAEKACTIDAWKRGVWRDGVANEGEAITSIPMNLDAARDQRGVWFDGSHTSQAPLERGKETLLVNAAIMDVKYKPINAPWVVDLDLPQASDSLQTAGLVPPSRI